MLPLLISSFIIVNFSIANAIMLEEGNKQQFTWMAYGATVRVWGKRGTFGANRLIARKDLMRIAANVARFEPVIMIVNDSKDKAEAKKFLDQVVLEPVSALSDSYEDGAIFTGGKSLPEIQLSNIKFVIQPVDDLWIRDTSAIFVTDSNQLLYGVNFNFNGWGQSDTGAKGWKEDKNKAANGIQYQPIENDQNIADFTISQTKAIKISTWLVMEGGGIEVDGKGTAICTESCIVNSNRNPGKTKADIELELERTLGVKKVLWLPGVKAKDITDGHIDFYARFSGNGHIIYALDNDPSSPDYKPTLLNKQILQNITDVSQNKLIPVPLNTPDLLLVRSAVTARNGWSRNSTNFNSDGFAASYAGFHAGEKYVLMSQYGDPNADLIAFKTLKDLFKGKSIIQITVDGISNGGGTIHCSTQESPLIQRKKSCPIRNEHSD